MSPNLESHNLKRSVDRDVSLILTPFAENDVLSEENNPIEETPEYHLLLDIPVPSDINYIPLQQNLRELLVRITNTEDLTTVTQVKLRVISREITLQHLNFYLPNLRELILDGSVIESLRDIGNGLRNLKVLRVNQCGLTCIDGVFSFENLEELYAADNGITSLAQCGFLSKLKIINMRRNLLTDSSLNYLTSCQNLEEVYLEGNVCIIDYIQCKQTLYEKLKKLRKLDDVILENEERPLEGRSETGGNQQVTDLSNSVRRSTGFSVTFPPRVCF